MPPPLMQRRARPFTGRAALVHAAFRPDDYAASAMSATVWLVIPTYNEADNLRNLVVAAAAELARAAPDDHRILIVDDNSPDGTGAIADELAGECEWVEVLHRPGKSGLGQAYLAGFARALSGGAQMVIEMDADFSHDPRYLPELLAAAEDADLVLGSRYVPGGGVRDWGLLQAAGQPRGRDLCTPDPRRPRPGPHGRLQVHPARGPGGDRPAERPGRGLRLPDRGHLPGPAGRLSRARDTHRVRRPRAG